MTTKMRTTFLTLCMAGGLVAVPAAQAASYISGFLGYAEYDDTDLRIGRGNVDTKYDGGWAAGGAVGWRLNQGDTISFRVEGELSYHKDNVDKHRISGTPRTQGDGGKLFTWALMANAYLDFNHGGSLSPYIGAGIGGAQVEFDRYDTATIPNIIDDDDSVFAYQIIAGATFSIPSPNTVLFAEYRFFKTDDASVDTSGITGRVANDIETESNNILVGVRHYFGAGRH